MAPFDPRMFDPSAPGHPPFLDSVVPFLARDASFTVDRLTKLDGGDPKGILTGRLDPGRAGMFGLSLGGAITAEACRLEPRLRACLMMDTFMPADVVRSGLRQPAMWISRDSASMRLERWPERDIAETQGTMRAVFRSLPGEGYLVLVPGAFHPNFSDMPLFSPLVRQVGLTGPIDPRRGLRIVAAFTRAFFDRELERRPTPLLEHPGERFPDVMFEARPRRGSP
jgi:pimeloyl-ACP methyl ester carboxylesterase